MYFAAHEKLEKTRPKHLFSIALALPGLVVADSTPVFTPPLASTQKIRGNLWVASNLDSNNVVLTGKDGPVVVDTSYFSPEKDFTSALQQFIRQQSGSDKAGTIILTHWHGDHTEGASLLRGPKTEVWSHAKTFRTMSNPAAMYSSNKELLEGVGEQWQRGPADPRSLPNNVFEGGFKLLVRNGESILLVHSPNAHTGGDTVVFFKSSKVVATGDVFFNNLFPIIDRENGGSLRGTIEGVRSILAMIDGDYVVVPAHGKVTDKGGLEAYLKMLVAAQARVRAAAERYVTEASVVASKPLEPLKAEWTAKLVDELKAFGLDAAAIEVAQNLDRLVCPGNLPRGCLLIPAVQTLNTRRACVSAATPPDLVLGFLFVHLILCK